MFVRTFVDHIDHVANAKESGSSGISLCCTFPAALTVFAMHALLDSSCIPGCLVHCL